MIYIYIERERDTYIERERETYGGAVSSRILCTLAFQVLGG